MPEFDRRLAVAGLIIFLLGFVGGMKYEDVKVKKESQQKSLLASDGVNKASESEAQKTKYIKVYVTGAVKKPGIFTLQEGDRVYQAVEMAGGLAEDADARNINLASVLQDGKSYSIPLVGENISQTNQGAKNSTASGEGGKVNINTASSQELEPLPGIGPALAERIIAYRQANGSFQSIEDLKNVSGIGEKKFASLKDLICTK